MVKALTACASSSVMMHCTSSSYLWKLPDGPPWCESVSDSSQTTLIQGSLVAKYVHKQFSEHDQACKDSSWPSQLPHWDYPMYIYLVHKGNDGQWPPVTPYILVSEIASRSGQFCSWWLGGLTNLIATKWLFFRILLCNSFQPKSCLPRSWPLDGTKSAEPRKVSAR